jgi:hypothetical protein
LIFGAFRSTAAFYSWNISLCCCVLFPEHFFALLQDALWNLWVSLRPGLQQLVVWRLDEPRWETKRLPPFLFSFSHFPSLKSDDLPRMRTARDKGKGNQKKRACCTQSTRRALTTMTVVVAVAVVVAVVVVVVVVAVGVVSV